MDICAPLMIITGVQYGGRTDSKNLPFPFFKEQKGKYLRGLVGFPFLTHQPWKRGVSEQQSILISATWKRCHCLFSSEPWPGEQKSELDKVRSPSGADRGKEKARDVILSLVFLTCEALVIESRIFSLGRGIWRQEVCIYIYMPVITLSFELQCNLIIIGVYYRSLVPPSITFMLISYCTLFLWWIENKGQSLGV